MPKNIVLCCDGTNNEFGNENTNVVKLYHVLRHDTPEQIAYYHPGLGSMGAPGALTPFAKTWTKLFGLGFGFGLSQHLMDLYQYVMEHYEPGDNLYVFGFSRGAYTARALCSILHIFGLVRCDDTVLIPYSIRLLKSWGEEANREIAGQFRATFSSQEVKPHFVGVWDTVSSVGSLHDPVKLPFAAFNPDITIGRHAISIDERRAFYRQNLWSPKSGQDIRQVWFSGVHCDIGGGYPESESGLSKITLHWMLCEARKAGMHLDEDKAGLILGSRGSGFAKPDPTAKLHDSLKSWWWAEVIPRRYFNPSTQSKHWKVPMGRRRFIRAGSHIHESVFQRMHADPSYRPSNVLNNPQEYEVETTECALGAGA